MSEAERATVDYFTDAKVGDRVWYKAGNEAVYVDGEWAGRGAWHLATVTKIARKYVTVSNEYGEQDFEIGTGIPRIVNGYMPPDHAYGEIDKWLSTARREIVRAVETSRNERSLIAVAKALGIPTPPETRPIAATASGTE